MKKRIVAAALAVLMFSGLAACTGTTEPETTTQTSAQTEAVTTSQAETTATEPETTAPETTTAAETTAEPTTVVQTVNEILTTIKNVTTTKAAATSATAATTTRPVYDENKPDDYYRIIEKVFNDDLKYGVSRRRLVTSYIEELDGTLYIVKQEISEYYNRLSYSADFSDLLPAALENKELYSATINAVLDIINSYRAEKNIAPLELSEELTEIACARAEEIAWSGKHSHTRPNGKKFSSLLKDAGITSGIAGENIGWGFSTAESVCQAWKDSEAHYENIMDPDFVKIGIGVAADPDPDGKLCWAQIFMNE